MKNSTIKHLTMIFRLDKMCYKGEIKGRQTFLRHAKSELTDKIHSFLGLLLEI